MPTTHTTLAALGLLAAASAATLRPDQAAGDASAVQAGAELYAAECAKCHGPEGEGMAHWAPRLNDQAFLRAVGNGFLFASIAKGRPSTSMVSWDTTQSHSDVGMRKRQVEQIVAFLRSWQDEDGVALDEAPLHGEVERGQRIYEADCLQCHGWQGSGTSEANVTIGIGHKAYLDAASDGYLRAVFGTRCKDLREVERMTPIPARSDYPLHYTPTQRDSVILYLRANAW